MRDHIAFEDFLLLLSSRAGARRPVYPRMTSHAALGFVASPLGSILLAAPALSILCGLVLSVLQIPDTQSCKRFSLARI